MSIVQPYPVGIPSLIVSPITITNYYSDPATGQYMNLSNGTQYSVKIQAFSSPDLSSFICETNVEYATPLSAGPDPGASTYSVYYVGNDGDASAVVDINRYETNWNVNVLFSPIPTRAGYMFKEWNTAANGTGSVYSQSGTTNFPMGTADVYLYAQWMPAYTVNYDGNGGTTTITDTNLYLPDWNVNVVFSPMPTRTGYAFKEWNTAANGAGSVYSSNGETNFVMGSANVTLYAQWTEVSSHSITYNVGVGVTGTTPSTVTGIISGDSYSSIDSGSGLSKPGYVFAGWSSSRVTDSNPIGSSLAGITEDITLTAVWYKAITINGVTPTGNPGEYEISWTYPENYIPSGVALYYSTDSTMTFLKLRENTIAFSFAVDNDQVSPLLVSGLTPDTTYYFILDSNVVEVVNDVPTVVDVARSPVFSNVSAPPPPTYTISYNLNGGEGTVPLDLTDYAEGASVTLPEQNGFSRTYYTFDGWSTTPTGSVINGLTYTMVAPTGVTTRVLYAIWSLAVSFSGAPTVSATSNPNEITASWSYSGTAPLSFAIEWKDASGNTGVVKPAIASNLSSITTAAPTGTYTFRMKAVLGVSTSIYSEYSSPAISISSALASVTTGTTTNVQTAVSSIVAVESGANLAAELLSNPVVQSAQVSATTGAATPAISIVTNAVNADVNMTTAQKVEKVAETLTAIAAEKGTAVTVLAAAQALAANSGNVAVKDTTIAALASAGIAVTAPFSLSVATAEEIKASIPNVSPELNTSNLSVQVSKGDTPIRAPETTGAAIYALVPPNTTVTVENSSGSVSVSYDPSLNSLFVNGAPKTVGDLITIGGITYIIRSKGTFTFEKYNQGGGGSPICFLGNAPVLTPSGYRRIDSLAVGDLVRTADGRNVAIQRVKHQRILTPSAATNPYVIPKGQWGATENVAISPQHCVAVPGRGMVEARELGLRQMTMRAAFDYYNLELPEWDNMVVAGVEVESLAPTKRLVITAAQFREFARSNGLHVAQLSNISRVHADGRVELVLTRKARRV